MTILKYIVFKERIYKIWKQFTTKVQCQPISVLLCSKNEYTKSESNSQLLRHRSRSSSIVFKERIYKIWKQFTTWYIIIVYENKLCSKNEYTKSESNSQHEGSGTPAYDHCVQRTNIQNLKAIHNLIYYNSLWK